MIVIDLIILAVLALASAAYPRARRFLLQKTGLGRREVVFSEDEPSKSLCEVSPDKIPAFAGEDYVELNGNVPCFTQYDFDHITGEVFSDPDRLGRCGPATAMLHRSMMPDSERGGISEVHPTGWHTARYPGLIEDDYLYNRSHLIAYAMTGQNANPLNLITGTHHMNHVGMLSFELKVLQYLDDSDGRVLYRVTPYFKDDELVARGVEMEACSVEDYGAGVSFHVFVYNYEPGITIDYRTGESRLMSD